MKKEINYFSDDEVFVSKGSEDYMLLVLSNEQYSAVFNNILKLRHILNAVRSSLGCPIYINSWLRSPERNKEVGGVSNSHHLTGAAADIRCDKSKMTKLYNILHDLLEYHVIGELIKYDNFIHVAIYD